MDDPRLNSMHLEPLRRQQFRGAREQLLEARGSQTCCLEHGGIGGESATWRGGHEEAAALVHDYCLLDSGHIYPLRTGVNTLGRSSENDVVVVDAYISRRHCAILVHAARGCELHDIASKNGTFLNGAKLTQPTPLKSGDQIRICDRQFLFLIKGQSPSSSRTFAEK
jgi:hypothetical protein